MDKIDSNWDNLKKDVFGNNTIYIRGYGRDAQKTKYFIALYKHLFGNEKIIKDATNNAQPTKLIKCHTNYCKKTKDGKNGKELIRNYQISHLFGRTKNPLLFNCAWNIAYIPKYLDPFTGHETQGEYSSEFKGLLLPVLKQKFDFYIKDYNQLIEDKVLNKIDYSLKEVKKDFKMNNTEFKRFEQDAKNELALIL
ncbi:hypothetical protein [Flavobacterium crocinum]|nr:hypothetical protein [Flavobacterium crocinum]